LFSLGYIIDEFVYKVSYSILIIIGIGDR